MIKNIAKDRVVIWIILALLICSTGGIYDFNMAFYGVIISLVLVFVVKRRGDGSRKKYVYAGNAADTGGIYHICADGG